MAIEKEGRKGRDHPRHSIVMSWPLFVIAIVAVMGNGCTAKLHPVNAPQQDVIFHLAIPSAEEVMGIRGEAKQGNAEAQAKLGVLYYYGKGVPQNYFEAAKWYQRAADQGQVEAQSLLGSMYHAGEGVSQDYVEAAKWLRLAAQHGEAGAQRNLGILYLRGQGVPQDDGEALKWCRLAAEQGDANALGILGYLYGVGRGAPQDRVLAYMWLNLAAAAGDAEAGTTRDKLGNDMSRDQIADAQRLSREWWIRHQDK